MAWHSLIWHVEIFLSELPNLFTFVVNGGAGDGCLLRSGLVLNLNGKVGGGNGYLVEKSDRIDARVTLNWGLNRASFSVFIWSARNHTKIALFFSVQRQFRNNVMLLTVLALNTRQSTLQCKQRPTLMIMRGLLVGWDWWGLWSDRCGRLCSYGFFFSLCHFWIIVSHRHLQTTQSQQQTVPMRRLSQHREFQLSLMYRLWDRSGGGESVVVRVGWWWELGGGELWVHFLDRFFMNLFTISTLNMKNH